MAGCPVATFVMVQLPASPGVAPTAAAPIVAHTPTTPPAETIAASADVTPLVAAPTVEPIVEVPSPPSEAPTAVAHSAAVEVSAASFTMPKNMAWSVTA